MFVSSTKVYFPKSTETVSTTLASHHSSQMGNPFHLPQNCIRENKGMSMKGVCVNVCSEKRRDVRQ